MSGPVYEPPMSLVPFFTADEFINLAVGPIGSTKTTAAIMKIAYEAKRVAACKDGIRRSRAVVIRNTAEQLRDTTIPDFLKWFPEGLAGTFLRTEKKFLLNFDDVECEVLFRGLDDSNDVRRLLSLQLSFGYLDEFREIHQDVFNALTGRLGRYPDKSMNNVGCCDDTGKQIHKVWGVTNPPDADTAWHTFLDEPPENAHVSIQPSGLSPEADWIQYLPTDYYENLCVGKSAAWINVYVHGKFGESLSGKPVFPSFDRSTHVAKHEITVLPSTLVIGVDAGLNPTAVITQQTYDGRVLIHDAITGQEGGMGALRFIREKLKPLLNSKYSGKPVMLVLDPAAVQRAQTDERSVMDIFKSEGFTVRTARTNNISARVAAVENFLTRTINGKPAFLVSPTAILVVKTMAGAYRYRTNAKGETDVTPEKNHPWSDVADSIEYSCMQHDGGSVFGGMYQVKRRPVSVVSAAGWT